MTADAFSAPAMQVGDVVADRFEIVRRMEACTWTTKEVRQGRRGMNVEHSPSRSGAGRARGSTDASDVGAISRGRRVNARAEHPSPP
jgi:hypothetical protein